MIQIGLILLSVLSSLGLAADLPGPLQLFDEESCALIMAAEARHLRSPMPPIFAGNATFLEVTTHRAAFISRIRQQNDFLKRAHARVAEIRNAGNPSTQWPLVEMDPELSYFIAPLSNFTLEQRLNYLYLVVSHMMRASEFRKVFFEVLFTSTEGTTQDTPPPSETIIGEVNARARVIAAYTMQWGYNDGLVSSDMDSGQAMQNAGTLIANDAIPVVIQNFLSAHRRFLEKYSLKADAGFKYLTVDTLPYYFPIP